MDFVIIFIAQMNQKADIINEINAVRLYKKLYLPCKLVGVIRIIQTKCFEDFDKKSPIIWKFTMLIVPKPCGKIKSIWAQFANWMKQ